MADYRFPGEWMKDNMVLEPKITAEAINQLESFEMKEDDVLIASYPKTGTTWAQELIWLLNNNADMKKALSVPVYERIPYVEYKSDGVHSNLEMLLKTQRPYMMKTHLPSDIFQKQIKAGKVKIIVIIRNPKDTLVSLYHFYRIHRGLGNFQGSWNDFFELYKTKHLIYGDYFEWYASWLEYKEKSNIKLLKYEDMHHRMSDVIDDLLQFLGKSLSEDSIADIIKHLTFDSMSSNDMVNYHRSSFFDMKVSSFMRKGIIGDWKNYFSDEQSAVVDKSYKDTFDALGVRLEFE
ncbi:hypothetical protein LSH36_44g07040 [Paralvinella palmiformis]|uniref:Sulfotransferase domain-containing protein n=1 Tax=Paralvinella palmiformis TaxID=53620 RepID=A0AAD9NDE9_9ANNE|nr:hypothetical protein LSH36_44g07040 [Paralvinella palmiformis]